MSFLTSVRRAGPTDHDQVRLIDDDDTNDNTSQTFNFIGSSLAIKRTDLSYNYERFFNI